MSKINKVAKHIHKHKYKTVILLIIIASITTVSLYFFMPKKSVTKNDSTTIAKSSIKTPDTSSQPLIYEYITTRYNDDKSSPRFIYYTPESDEDRLIALNDKIISDLKNTGKITDQTNTYFIDYFNNKEIANTYNEKINDKSLTQISRIKLISSYTASMNYSKQMEINQLFLVSKAKILKQY